MSNHQHDFKFVRTYWVGGSKARDRVYWKLYRCACGKEKREKA